MRPLALALLLFAGCATAEHAVRQPQTPARPPLRVTMNMQIHCTPPHTQTECQAAEQMIRDALAPFSAKQ